MKINFFLVILFFLSFAFVLPTNAEEETGGIRVSPSIIDEKANASDLFKYEIKIENLSDKRVNIYSKVDDVLEDKGATFYEGPGTTDRQISLASWILFRRALIRIEPGESTTIPLDVEVSNTAKPGKRYAQITLPYGTNQLDAHNKTKTINFPKITLNFNIEENVVENAQLKMFKARKNIFINKPIDFYYIIENTGNRPVKPKGNIYIFNKRGIEVASLALNAQEDKIGIGEEQEFEVNWIEAVGLGKFKAKLEIEYGEKNRRDLSDTIYFWFFPLKWIIVFGSILFFLLIFLTYLISSRTYQHYHHGENSKKRVALNGPGVLNLRDKE